MKIQVLFFGQLEQFTSCKSEEIEGVSTVKELRAFLAEKYPALRDFEYLLALNQEILNEDAELKNADELALLPPFAGG